MKTFAAITALVALIPAALGLTIDTPSSVVVCQPILLNWHDGTPPYYPTVVAPGPGQTYKQFDQTDGTSLTWKVDIPVGTEINLGIKDSTGAQQYSATVTVTGSSDTSCLSASASSGASGGSTGSTAATSGAAASSGAATTTGASSGTSAAASGSSAASTKASSSAAASGSSSSSSDNGAISSTVSKMGVAAVMGLVGAALF